MAGLDVAGLIASDITANLPGWTIGVNLFANRAPAASKLPDPNGRYCVIIPAVVTRNGLPTNLSRPAPFTARIAIRVIGASAGDAFAGAADILDRYVAAVKLPQNVSVWSDTASPVLISIDAGGRTEYGGTLTATWEA